MDQLSGISLIFSRVIGYVEAHLGEEIDHQEVAKLAGCSVYQFGRIFSYVVGISFSEYVRRRRLTQAALALQQGGRVLDTALSWGYGSPEAFARAFRELHGVSPREACRPGVILRLYPPISFQILVKGEDGMEFRLEEKGVVKGVGVVKNFGVWKEEREAEHWQDRMGEVWRFWEEYLDGSMNEIVRDKYKLYRPPFYQMGVTYLLDNGETVVAIGAEDSGGEYPELTPFEIPAGTWAVFTARGSLNQQEHPINRLTTQIFTQWLPNSGYEKSMDCQIEVYGPGNTQQDDYTCELWIPVKKK